MQFRQPVVVGLVDEDGVRRGDVETALDDGGRDQDVRLALDELDHRLFQVVSVHLAVRHHKPGLGHDAPQSVRQDVDVVHAGVHEKDLPLAVQFAQHGVADQALVKTQHPGLHRLAVGRGRLQIADVADPQQGLVQRAGDRGGGHGEHIHLFPQQLQLFLVLHAEPLFLVDDHQPQVLEADVGAHQAVCAHHDVHRALGQLLHDLPLFRLAPETVQAGHREGVFRHAGAEGAVVLLGQHRGGYQHRHLAAGIGHLERCPQGQFGLAETHVAADQPVHRAGALEITLDLTQAHQLVLGFAEWEGRLKFALPFAVGRPGPSRVRGTRRLQADHVRGQIDHRLGGLVLLLLPGDRSETRQLHAAAGGSHIFLHEVNARDGHEHPHPLAKLQHQMLFRAPGPGGLLGGLGGGGAPAARVGAGRLTVQKFHAQVARDTVRHMHHHVAGGQVEERVDGAGFHPPFRRRLFGRQGDASHQFPVE